MPNYRSGCQHLRLLRIQLSQHSISRSIEQRLKAPYGRSLQGAGSKVSVQMISFAALLSPLALLLPSPAAQDAAQDETGLLPETEVTAPARLDPPITPEQMLGFDQVTAMPIVRQVRIQQRVIIRVSPRRTSGRQNLVADVSNISRPKTMVERKIGKCIDLKGIAGVQASRDNRLMLYMRDQRLIMANLEKACSARDFYSGFYVVDPRKDGQLCISRDKIQSRTGAKCKLSRIRQMVAQ